MNILSEDKKAELGQEKKEASEKIEKNAQSIEAERKNIRALEEKIIGFKDQMEEMSNDIWNKTNFCKSAQKESHSLVNRVAEIERIEQDDKREREIAELMDTQPSFYVSLEKRISEAKVDTDEELSAFIGTIEPAKATEGIKIKIESRAFDNSAITLRSVKSTYEKLMRELCEKKVDGAQISIGEANEPREYLKRIILHPEILTYWQR